MFYIAPEWLNDKSNEQTVRSILEKHLFSDVNMNPEGARKELEEINEFVIAEKLNEGYFTH